MSILLDNDIFWNEYIDYCAEDQAEYELEMENRKKEECTCPICHTIWDDKYEVYACSCQDRIGGYFR